jgi:hypothetical protein
MTCQCDDLKQKMDALEKILKVKRWAFVHRGEAIMLVKMTRDECRHEGSNKTTYCQNGACASGCDVWKGIE